MSDWRVGAGVLGRRLLVILVHLGLWAAALGLALELRFDFRPPSVEHRALLGIWLPALLAARVLAFHPFGLFRGLWRYTGAHDLLALVAATSLGSAAVTALLVGTGGPYSRSVLAIEWVLSLVLVAGLRFSTRVLATRELWHWFRPPSRRRTLVVGGGNAGAMLIREMRASAKSAWEPVGILDDDPGKAGALIHGVKVLGRIARLPELVQSHRVSEIVIAIPSAGGGVMRRVVELCKRSGARFKTIPGLEQIIDGRVTVSQLRDVAIEDLLGRDPVVLDADVIAGALTGRSIMVTGAGGSIGSEMCRQLCRVGPERLVLVEHGENALFHVHRELVARFPDLLIVPVIADVTDPRRMEEVFQRHRPQAVFHAAAHKHVPMMELNPGEAVKNNVFGTRTLADLADRFGVDRFVMISTDKAVNPTSVMGATKRCAEIYVQALSQRSRTRFVTVRFGNVLGSEGSVIPLFKEQIARGGPVTVTHPEMKRYFMTIPEAAQLVMQAGAMGNGGEIYILDMGEPVKIVDLARDLIQLSGFVPGQDIEIAFSGMRPGEKLFEELSVDAEVADKTRHPKIFVGHFRPHAWETVQRQLHELVALADARSLEVRRKLSEIVPEYSPSRHVADAPGASAPAVPPPAKPDRGRAEAS